MGIQNAVRKTIAYAKRNGVRAAFFAALERVSDTAGEKYDYRPLSKEVLSEQRQEYKALAERDNPVRFSIVVPLYDTPEKYLREMIESVINQTYGNWELILADASAEPLTVASGYAKEDPRIRYIHLESNDGIAANTNRGLKEASGDYIGLLDHDDVLTPDALYEVDRVIRKSMKANKLAKYSDCPIRLIYSDEDKFDDVKNSYYECHKKPAFNMDYLLSNNYICHFTVIRADIIKRLKLRSDFDGAQDFDLVLRACSETALSMPLASDQIAHIDKVLYHWRCHQNSTAANPASKSYAYEAGGRAIKAVLEKNGVVCRVAPLKHLGFYRVDYEPDIFSRRTDIGCVGGRVVNKKNRICGGMYGKDRTLRYEGLSASYSGGFQHRAAVQQDAYAVDIRCISVRPELIPLFEETTGLKYVDSFAVAKGAEKPEAAYKDVSLEAIPELSVKFGAELKKRGYRAMWDPEVTVYTKC